MNAIDLVSFSLKFFDILELIEVITKVEFTREN
jgi:hypothetical protein